MRFAQIEAAIDLDRGIELAAIEQKRPQRGRHEGAAQAADKPGHVPSLGQILDGHDARHSDRDRGHHECSQQAPHEASQELLNNEPPPGPRNLFAKLIHDEVPREDCG